MSHWLDPDLDFLESRDLRELASLLSARHAPEPPLDPAFRSQLRRELLRQQWQTLEVREPIWRRVFTGPGLAWSGAAVGAVLVAAAVLFAIQPTVPNHVQLVSSPLDHAHNVALVEPMQLQFQQPMDHASVESALHIEPATAVTYAWQGNTLLVQPQAGQLAANTQYKLTLDSKAQTTQGRHLDQDQTFVFVTAAPPSPSPAPTPTPAGPAMVLANAAQLGPAGSVTPAWSPDGTTIYYAAPDGSLQSLSAAGGTPTPLDLGGVLAISVAPDGQHLAVLAQDGTYTLKSDGSDLKKQTLPSPLAVGWRQGGPVAATSAGEFTWDDSGKTITPLATFAAQQVAIAPAGDALLYTDLTGTVHLLQNGQDAPWTTTAASLPVWSAAGDKVAFATDTGIDVSGPDGLTPSQAATFDQLGAGSAADVALAWSDGQVLAATPGGLYAIETTAPAVTQVSTLTFSGVSSSPKANSVAWLRDGALWTAGVSRPAQRDALAQQARSVVEKFLADRAAGDSQGARAYLDEQGRKVYDDHKLLLKGDTHLTRWFVVYVQPLDDGTATVFTRLLLARKGVEERQLDELLTLQPDAGGTLLVHDASFGKSRNVDSGPEVLSITTTPGQVQVVFDSDLDPTTAAAITLTGPGGVSLTGTYGSRTLTFDVSAVPADLALKLIVPTSVKDVNGTMAAQQLQLSLLAPEPVAPALAPSPSPSPVLSPSP